MTTGCYSNGTCRECAIQSVKNRRLQVGRPPRSEKEKETKKRWEKENQDRVRSYARQNYADHRSHRLISVKDYSQTPKGKEVHRQASFRYRDRNRLSLRDKGRLRASHITNLLAAEIVEYYGPACVYCGGDASGFDHLNPVAKGGEISFENLAPCCWDCNRRKGDRPSWTMLSPEGGEKSSCLVTQLQ